MELLEVEPQLGSAEEPDAHERPDVRTTSA